MTREEAITALGDRNNLLWGMSKEEKKYYSEALDMAISALSESTNIEKIRAEVLEYIDDLDIADCICEVFEKYDKAVSE